ncbi:MAG: DUF3090 family protein [Chloroflexi bacterium]|nr:DUF3090 family protein [Chloroflexota bacterium]
MAMTVLLLVRHASNDYVKEGRLAGWTPGVHLNAAGQREADALAQRLNHIPIAAIYSSPLERAVETAQAIGLCQHLEVQIRPALGELGTGEWTGKLIKELEGAELWKQVQTAPAAVRIPGGESFAEMQTRMVAALDAIVAAHPNQVVAVVSHADPLKSAIAHYLSMDLNQFQRIAISPASVTVFFFGEHSPVLFRLNDSAKLPSFKIEPPKPKSTPEAQDPERKEKTAMPEANILYDLNPVTHITAGVIGKPGKRTFYLQARQSRTIVTLIAEKEQMSALSAGIDQLLERLGGSRHAVQVTATQMELAEPIEPLFRIGQLGLGYDAEQSLLVLVAYELPQEEDAPVVNVVRFWATQDQMRALARHAAGIVAAGRPICVLCGRPIDPEGHFCPKRNGHGEHAPLT